jgi:hypothetical protein
VYATQDKSPAAYGRDHASRSKWKKRQPRLEIAALLLIVIRPVGARGSAVDRFVYEVPALSIVSMRVAKPI